MKTSEILKILRENKNLSQAELADELELSRSSISMYERGERVPSTYVLEQLSDFFNVDIDYLMGRTTKTTILPETIKYSTPRDQRSRTILRNMRKLNLDGQDKVIEYSELLVESKQYENPHTLSEEQSSYITDEYIESYSVAKAAAGSGAYNEHYQDTTYHLIKSVDVPKHDEQIDVKGNSMEPTIMDGDVAFLKFNPDCLNNRIYVIQYKDETFIKRCFFDDEDLTLVSDNPDYENIEISGEELNQTKVVAEVVGWTTPIE